MVSGAGVAITVSVLLSLPLLLINGELRISGEFDIRMLLDAIDTKMEIKS